MKTRISILLMGVALIAGVPAARAAGNADADALKLADQAEVVPQRAQDWRVSVEGAASSSGAQRMSLDAVYDGKLAGGVRAVFSDRLDLVHVNGGPSEGNVNTLREVYLSWEASPQAIIDAGRINLRYGVAYGYNPTDFFKAGAVRAVVSPAPQSLRENRQGTAVLQGQMLGTTDSVSLVLSPKLGGAPNAGAASLDWGATNARNRWLLTGTHKLNDSFSPQLLLFGSEGLPTQLGLNLSGLVTGNTTAFGEFSAGRGPSLAAQAAGDAARAKAWQRRVSTGFTTTTRFNLTITTELELNNAAPDWRQWNAMGAGSARAQLRLLATAQSLQDLPVRRALFTYASWQDIFIQHLDLTGFVRVDLETHSRAQWVEARYHRERADVALQWQVYSGHPGSVYASVPQQRNVQAVMRFFF